MVRGSPTRVLLAVSGLVRSRVVAWRWWSSRRIGLTGTVDFDSPRGRGGCWGAGHRAPAAPPALASRGGHGGPPRARPGPRGRGAVVCQRRVLPRLPRPVHAEGTSH